MNQPYRTVIFAIIGLIAWGCGGNNSTLTEPGVSFDLAKYRAANIRNLRYEVHLIIPEAESTAIQGQETIYADILDLSESLILDFKAPEDYLTKIIVNGSETEYLFADEHIIIDNKFLLKGENIIELTFRVGETSLNRNPEFLYTLFVPDRARTAFPCFDQPNLKGKYTLSLTIPESWQALGNGAIIDVVRTGESKTLKFAETKPLSTYLFDFVAGKFEIVERTVGGRLMTMLHRETDSLKVARNLDDIFSLHLTALDWLEDYTGIEYPFQKFGFAIIPSFQYGGMEHP